MYLRGYECHKKRRQWNQSLPALNMDRFFFGTHRLWSDPLMDKLWSDPLSRGKCCHCLRVGYGSHPKGPKPNHRSLSTLIEVIRQIGDRLVVRFTLLFLAVQDTWLRVVGTQTFSIPFSITHEVASSLAALWLGNRHMSATKDILAYLNVTKPEIRLVLEGSGWGTS